MLMWEKMMLMREMIVDAGNDYGEGNDFTDQENDDYDDDNQVIVTMEMRKIMQMDVMGAIIEKREMILMEMLKMDMVEMMMKMMEIMKMTELLMDVMTDMMRVMMKMTMKMTEMMMKIMMEIMMMEMMI